MFSKVRTAPSSRLMLHCLRSLPWLFITIILGFTLAHAQQITATLSGIAVDQTDARIPGALVVVKNEASLDIRSTKADDTGFFSVTALMPGTYTVTISAQGFSSWELKGILLNQGDSRTIPNIHLKVGAESA